MGKQIIKELEHASERERKLIDDFILNPDTNGEFINSLNYLGYHPRGRFEDKSIFIVDEGSGNIRGVFIAAEDIDNPKRIISHPGTTFAGIIVNKKLSIKNLEEIVNLIMEYYEKRYESIVVRLRPEFFDIQPFGEVSYFLLRRGYRYCMSGLSNVIDISNIHNEDDIFRMYDATKRNQVRKALREKQFIINNTNKLRKDVWDNMNNTLKEKHNAHSTHTFDEIEELMRRVPTNISAYYAEKIDGEYGAFALVYKFKNIFHTQYLDTNYKYTGQYPNLLLIHNLLQIARQEGYAKFSFGVSTENHGLYLNCGLFNYKSGYGGGSVVQAEYEWMCEKKD